MDHEPLEIFVEPFLPRPELIVIGEAPVAQALARFGALLDFNVCVSDPAATRERFPDAETLYAQLEAVRTRISLRSYVVVATQGAYDEEALEAVIDTRACYLGLVASGKRATTIFQYLRDKGVQPELLQHVKCPAGLQSHLDSGGSGALMTCLDGTTIGAKLLLDNGHTLGSLGDTALDQAVCAAVLPELAQGLSRTLSFVLPHTTVRVFVEVHTPPATLIIVGASHMAMLLVQLAWPIGFYTIVVDSRPRFATPERFPATDTLLVGIPSEIVKTLRPK